MGRLLRSAVAGLLVAAVLAASPAPAASPPAQAEVHARKAPRMLALSDAYERALIREVNRVRAQHGLRPLRRSSCLDLFAANRARRMAANRLLAHLSGLTAAFARCGGSRVGENIASGRQLTAKRAVDAWMASPSHRTLVLRPAYRHVAVGAWRVSGGNDYVSMVFRAP